MNIENLKKVRESIAATHHEDLGSDSIMNLIHQCGTPSCIVVHAYCISEALDPDYLRSEEIETLKEEGYYLQSGSLRRAFTEREEDWDNISKVAKNFLELTDQEAKDLFTPEFEDFDDYRSTQSEQDFIEKINVLDCLYLIIGNNGNIKIDDAWLVAMEAF